GGALLFHQTPTLSSSDSNSLTRRARSSRRVTSARTSSDRVKPSRLVDGASTRSSSRASGVRDNETGIARRTGLRISSTSFVHKKTAYRFQLKAGDDTPCDRSGYAWACVGQDQVTADQAPVLPAE